MVETQTASGDIDPRTQGRKVHLIKPDGSSKTDIGLSCKMSAYMKSSSDGNSIAYSNGDIFAQEIDFSSGKPAKKGQPKKIGQGIPQGSGRDWDAGAKWIFARSTYSGGMPGYAYEIPSGGTASKSTALGPSCNNQCGQAVSQSNIFIAFNQGCGRAVGCIAEDHKGVAVIDTRKPVIGSGGAKSPDDMVKWNLQSGVFIWCPEIYTEDGTDYDLRAGKWNQSEFHHYKFTNNDDYIIATHQRAKPLNIWLINWKTAKWTPLMKSQKDVGGNWSGGTPKNGDAYLGESVSSAINPAHKSLTNQRYINRMQYLQTWHDVLGRKMPSSGLRNARGMQVSAESKRIEMRAAHGTR
jgi:hypothetical protein